MHHKYLVATIGSLGLFVLINASQADARVHAPDHQTSARARHGVAVWYGEDRDGKVMANGQIFDQWAMTGASVRFPLGTRVRVTDVATHKHVIVTITDHTISNSHVLIDLSHGAGKALGIEVAGKAHVEALPIGFDRKYARRVVPAVAKTSTRVTDSRN